MKRLLNAACATAVLVSAFVMAGPVRAASLTQVTNFGNNPSNLNMYVYVPNNVAARPALLVAIHFISGTENPQINGITVTG